MIRLTAILSLLIFLTSLSIPCTVLGQRGHLVDEILTKGELRVGVSPGFIPFVVDGNDCKGVRENVVGELEADAQTGVIGFDVELARALAASLNVRLVLVKANGLKDLQQLVDDGRVHMALSGLTRTLERAWSFYISDPYFVSGLIILVPQKSPYHTLKDLNVEKATILVKPAATSETFARENLPNARIEALATEADMITRLNKGDAAIIVDAVKARSFVVGKRLVGKFRRLEQRRFTDEYFGIIMQRDGSLIRYVNLFIDEYKRSGKFHDLSSRFNLWFRQED